MSSVVATGRRMNNREGLMNPMFPKLTFPNRTFLNRMFLKLFQMLDCQRR
jgi:hypothetical protein